MNDARSFTEGRNEEAETQRSAVLAPCPKRGTVRRTSRQPSIENVRAVFVSAHIQENDND